MQTENGGKTKWQRLLAVLLVLLCWEAAARLIGQSLLLPAPLAVLRRLWLLAGEPGFWQTVWFSLCRIGTGFLLGLAAGILLAALSARFPLAENLLWPFIQTVKTVPVASFIIICLIWLDSSRLSVFISFLIVLPAIYRNVLAGYKAADRKLWEMARVFRLPLLRRLRYVRLPQLGPYLLAACETALGLAWKSGVAAEVIGIPDGSLGERLYFAKVYLNSEELFAWTLLIVLLSVAFEKLILLVLRTFLGGMSHEKSGT